MYQNDVNYNFIIKQYQYININFIREIPKVNQQRFFFFFGEFQHMASAFDNRSLLSDQNINQFLV